MLIDLHAHTAGASPCCRAAAPRIIEDAQRAGIDALLITNHYCKTYIEMGDTPEDYARKYVEEYRYTKACAEAVGFTIFFGVEATMEREGLLHFVAIGVGENFPLLHPEMYDYTIDELSEAVHAEGGILIQAHPYRKNNTPRFTEDAIDGAEVSCHPYYDGTHIDELLPSLQSLGKILTVGGDYHCDTRRTSSGVYIPDTVKNAKEIADFLKSAKSIKIRYEEPWDETFTEAIYTR